MNNRQYIRHPSSIPLEYCVINTPRQYEMDFINNVSQGGLSFHSTRYIEADQWVHLYIPINENYFESDAQVCWCKPSKGNTYDVGVVFPNKQEAFSARMVEQVCHIEEYRKAVKKEEGRDLNSDQAAAEWIEKYAEHFPETCFPEESSQAS